ncbi:hypothetical protein MKW98_028587 [Papaver atlanticum]|uniref:SHSP domain-containing protein n=1 Tax=Papaver atlanticum TaxID=357466 RepID=A0AAD4TAA0_9MAGN|nr:hypothetical protein MKW98_028587 [Papaver atlanticum]
MILSFQSFSSIIWVSFLLIGFQISSTAQPINNMKVHPAPKRSHYDINSTLSNTNRIINRQKKLRRLPHIFNKVLELPFHSETDVLIEENSDLLRFSVSTENLTDDVSAHMIEIYPGVTKIVIRGSNVDELNILDEFELWRFRLPQSTTPELAAANYINGELVVTVPKSSSLANQENGEEEGEVWGGEGENGDFRGGRVSHLVLVQ